MALRFSVNSYKRYQPESWAPTALAWGRDNRTCGFRVVGQGASFRVESRLPGADVNPYCARGDDRRGLHGIEHDLDPGAPYDGNAPWRRPRARKPATLVDAIGELERSEVAVKAFGSDVHEHLVNTARQEWAGFNRAVTDWERRRNFEQFLTHDHRLADCGARASGEGGTGAGLGEAGGCRADAVRRGAAAPAALEAILMPVSIDDADAAAVLERFDGSC